MSHTKELYILLDSSGYVINGCRWYEPLSGYISLGDSVYPDDLLCGCYQLIDGEFILDQDKYDELHPEELDEFGNPINPASSPL